MMNYLAAVSIGFALIQSIPSITQQPTRLTEAQALNHRGADHLAKGQGEQAFASWQQAHKIYTELQDFQGIVGTEINQAQALQSLGYYRQALVLLQSTQAKLQQAPNSILKAQGLLSLGNTLRSLGALNAKSGQTMGIKMGSTEALTIALAIAQELQHKNLIDQINLSLAHTWVLLGNPENRATRLYQTIQNNSSVPILRIQAQLQLYRLDRTPPDNDKTLAEIAKLRQTLDTIPPNRQTIYAYLNFAQAIQKRQPDRFTDREVLTQVSTLLTKALSEAQAIQDPRGQTQALGSLGSLYQFTGQYPAAQKLTEQAIVIAESLPAPDLAYRWQWQLGKILTLRHRQSSTQAITAYRQAIFHLKTLRNDLNGSDTDLQFSFRESVEPVYRELVSLLLQDGKLVSDAHLTLAIDLMESLQIAELENYLRQGCLDTYKVSLDRIDRSATIVYPIILPDRIVVISSIPGQKLRYYSRKISQQDLSAIISSLREQIISAEFNADREKHFKQQSQRLHDILIAPISKDLKAANTKTLVFILDGELRNIPMSILHDGDHYLVEKYNLALTPAFQLVPAQNTDRQQYQAFLGGISSARQGYAPLPSVEKELQEIGKLLPHQQFLNAQFTQAQATKQLSHNKASIIHIATHGAFSSNPEETFLLTWDGQLNLYQFSQLLQDRNRRSHDSIDLLVLSACETASGDRRATLGLAGIAIRARTRSTIASLWIVNDRSTQVLMTNLYQNLLIKKLSKAASLRLAQQTLLQHPQYRNPFYWSPFVLVGNWQ